MPSLRELPLRLYNAAHKRIWPVPPPPSSSPELQEIADHVASVPSDISDHLLTIFSETVAAHPRLIVELGVRGGESRFALERAAKVSGSGLISVDIDDCTGVCGESPIWYFVKSDDIEFAQIFPDWCSRRGIEPQIDVLFIDTSHIFEHTVQEMKKWFPYLSPNCKILFHDTNTRRFYHRLDGTIGWGEDCKRGVIQAIEEYLGFKFNERVDFVTTVQEWLVRHWAHCNGFTVMERTQSPRKNIEIAGKKSGDYTQSVTVP